MSNQGWVKAYRQLLDWEWYTDVPTFKLFLHLLLIVNREPQQWRGQTLSSGSVVTSISALASGSGLSDMQVRTAETPSKNWRDFQECNKQKYRYYPA